MLLNYPLLKAPPPEAQPTAAMTMFFPLSPPNCVYKRERDRERICIYVCETVFVSKCVCVLGILNCVCARAEH